MRSEPYQSHFEGLLGRVIGFLAAAAFFAVSLISAPVAEASHQAWQIDPGIDEDDVFQYGWHWDEGDDAFGARDFNHPDDDEGLIVYLRLSAEQDLPFSMRYNRDSYDGGCGMQAQLQAYSGGWFTITGTELRYLHITNPGTGVTSTFVDDNDTVYALAGTIAHSGLGSQCIWGGPSGFPMLHQSARLGASFYRARVFGDDTCWIEDSEDTGQCEDIGDEDNYERAHDDCAYDYFDEDPPYVKSGEIWGEYDCAEWSQDNHSEGTWVFDVPAF